MGTEAGTLLNGESVAIAPLADGDVIKIGETRLVFKAARVIAAPAGAGAKLVAPKVKLDLPTPKAPPKFEHPETKVVKVKLKSARDRAREAADEETSAED